MNAEDQPTIPTAAPNGSRPSSVGWQAPSVEEMQAMLPQYEIMEILGRGGMGAVYKGRQKSLKRLVAIKILPLGMADDEMKFAERFQNEAQTMAAMNHPAIVSVYDFGETPDGLLYFVMEFVDGTDVQKMIQASGRLTGEHALAITAHVCDALAYAHKRGVIHRDIKPANILIDQEGHIKVADFGLAKMHDPSQTSGLTRTGTAMGTPDYVAPEVLSPGMVADHRADLYAVGVMLYEMLTGEVPRGMFKLPSQKGIGSDPRFDEIICKAMEHDREERYQSAMDVRQALDVILTTAQGQNGDAGTSARSLAPRADVSARITKKPAALWLSIGGSVAVLGIAGFFIFGGSSNTNPDPASASASAARESQPTIKMQENGMSHPDLPPQIRAWRDVTAEARETAKTNPSLVVTEKGIEKQGDAANPRLLITPPGQRDQAVRMRYTGYGQVDLHGSDRGFLYVMAQPNQTIFHSQASGSSAPPVKLIPNKLHPPGFDPKQPHELLVTIEGTRLRAWVDGRFAGEAKADTYTEGVTGLIITPETIVHQVELGELAGAALPGPPSLKWQDATATFREKAAVLPGVEIKDDAVRLADGASPQRVFITPPGVRDFAVRVRYAGGVQIDRLNEESAFDFILCQRKPPRVAFKRYTPSNGATEDIAEAVSFPAGYDETQPHQLVAVIEGPRMRVWVDDQFMGEANDDRITSGAGAIALKGYTPIYKVEIAESNSGPVTAERVWTDWLGPKLAAGDFAANGWVRSSNGVSTEREISGTRLLPPGTKNAAVRVTYVLQDSEGLMLNAREKMDGKVRLGYCVIDKVTQLHLNRLKPDGRSAALQHVTLPAVPDRMAERTLEMRMIGNQLKATLNGTFAGTATDDTLSEGEWTLVCMKGVLVKKVEVQTLDGAGP